MSYYKVNLAAMYHRAFPLQYMSGLPFSRMEVGGAVTQAEPFDQWEDNDDKAPQTGLLGTPIHLPIKLDDYQLPNEPLVEMSGSKLIVMTPVDGNDGTFKEHYSTGDMQIVIRGVCVYDDKPDSYPEDQVRAIRNLIEKRTHLRVRNRLTAMWNVEHLAVVDYSFPAIPGALGMQPYELRCLSDKEFQLRVRER